MKTTSLTARLAAAAASVAITFGLLSVTVAQAGLSSPAQSQLLAQGQAIAVR